MADAIFLPGFSDTTLLDTHPATPTFADAALRANDVFSDPESGLHVKLLGITAAGDATLLVEVPGNASSNAEAIIASIREITKLRGEVDFRMPGELPNDGKVIEDARKYD